jgi:hypothetical protein
MLDHRICRSCRAKVWQEDPDGMYDLSMFQTWGCPAVYKDASYSSYGSVGHTTWYPPKGCHHMLEQAIYATVTEPKDINNAV